MVEDRAALDDPVADGSDLIKRVDDLALAFQKGILDPAERDSMVRKVCVSRKRSAVEGLPLDMASRDADALAEALGDDLFVLHIDELIFEGRAPAVDDQYLHSCFSQ